MFLNSLRQFSLPIAILLFSGTSVLAADSDRNLATKLTNTTKPQVKVMAANKLESLTKEAALVELKVDPNQIVCRQTRVGSASRIKMRSCKTRAEFRREDGSRKSRSAQVIDDTRRAQRVGGLGRNEAPRRNLPFTGR